MGRLPQTNTTVSRYLRQQKRVVTRMANATPYALSGTSVTAPGLMKVDERLVAGDPAGSRVELDSAGLRKYAADGTTVQVDLTGEVAAFSGLITGSEIVAGTAGAARLELDAAGLRQYAADGTTVLLDTADSATIRVQGGNTAFGTSAQQALTTGFDNTAVGPGAQQALTDGYRNTAVGPGAQQLLATGLHNTAVGAFAQSELTTGSRNTAIGRAAQRSPLGEVANATATASYQTSIGPETGQSSPTQVDGITTIGYQATAGAANATSIGREARADHAGSIALGYQALTTQINQVMVGPRDVEITDTTKGLVLVSPDATRMRFTAADDGSLLVNGTAIGGGSAASPLVLTGRITTAQAIGAGAWTAIQWNSRSEDTAMNPTTDSGTRLVALTAGLYHVSTTAIFQNTGGGPTTDTRSVRFGVTDVSASTTTYYRGSAGPACLATMFSEMNGDLYIRLDVDDYVVVEAYANVALNIMANQGTRAAMTYEVA